MGHILFGIPEIEHYHLHSRLARKLVSREHRVSMLAGDPVAFEFYSAQGLCTLELGSGGRLQHQAPLSEFALLDCLLCGHRHPGRGRIRRAERRLARVLPGLIRLFETDPPDLLLLHQGRSGRHRLLHFLARQFGARVLHTGKGLLPHTMQWDSEGVDGDASYARLRAQDYRRCPEDQDFLEASLSAWLARAYPPPLARIGLRIPGLLPRLRSMARALLSGQVGVAAGGLWAWEKAHPLNFPRREDQPCLPETPFLTVLLQPPHCLRILLDASGTVHALDLVQAAQHALALVDPLARLAIVLPEGGLEAGELRQIRRLEPESERLRFLPATAGPLAVSTALAVVTINHPLGLAATLAGTPVLHLGRSPYGIRGVCHRSSLDLLPADLPSALSSNQPSLRRRFLTRMLRQHHLWCSVHQPDSNGIAGLVGEIENRLVAVPDGKRPLPYRPGPTWPLSTK